MGFEPTTFCLGRSVFVLEKHTHAAEGRLFSVRMSKTALRAYDG